MIRLATADDAGQLIKLNTDFNGESAFLEKVRDSLLHNRQEIVVVAEENGVLAGFVCVQLKRSFCYTAVMPEITEVYVDPAHRRKGLASGMINFAQTYCTQKYPLDGFTLLTGSDNKEAQALYTKLGYREDGEIHLVKEKGSSPPPAKNNRGNTKTDKKEKSL